jgi:hypothetical protein
MSDTERHTRGASPGLRASSSATQSRGEGGEEAEGEDESAARWEMPERVVVVVVERRRRRRTRTDDAIRKNATEGSSRTRDFRLWYELLYTRNKGVQQRTGKMRAKACNARQKKRARARRSARVVRLPVKPCRAAHNRSPRGASIAPGFFSLEYTRARTHAHTHTRTHRHAPPLKGDERRPRGPRHQ